MLELSPEFPGSDIASIVDTFTHAATKWGWCR